MNKSNKYSGWVLCPSNSLQGKFYYFNVLTGESVWSLNGSEESTLKKNNTIKKTDYLPKYPEPLLPLNTSFTNKYSDESQIGNSPISGRLTFQNHNSKLKPTIKRLQPQKNILSSSKLFCYNQQTLHDWTQKQTVASKQSFQNKDSQIPGGVMINRPSFLFKDYEPASIQPMKTDCFNFTKSECTGIRVNDKHSEETNKFISSISIHFLRNLGNAPIVNDWYIVADKNVLLEDFVWLAKFIKKDRQCKLLTPRGVMIEIETMSRNMSNGQSDVLSARILLRRLSECEHVEQPEEDTEDEVNIYVTLDIKIIKCCLLMKKRNKHVVLITNSLMLNYRAKMNNIHVYSINEIKNESETITADDDIPPRMKTVQNIFLQSKDEFDPFMLSKCYQRDTNSPSNDLFKPYDRNNYKDTYRIYNSKYIEPVNVPTLYSNICRGMERLNTGYGSRALALRNMNTYREPTVCSSDESLNSKNKESNFRSICNRQVLLNTRHTWSIDKFSNCKSDRLVCDNNDSTSGSIHLEQNLKEFYIKNETILKNIKGRFKEWACRYMQIMEEFLFPPWQKNNPMDSYWLQAQLQNIKETHYNDEKISLIVNKLIALYDRCVLKGKIDHNTSPETFMTILGVSMLLVEAVEAVTPYPEITDTKNMLKKLLIDIQNPPIEDIFMDMDYCVRNTGKDSYPAEAIYQKSRSDVAAYLKKHFHNAQDNTQNINGFAHIKKLQQPYSNHNLKIIQTTGKYASSLKINSKNQLYSVEPHDTEAFNGGADFQNVVQTRVYEIKNSETKDNNIDVPVLHGNTFSESECAFRVERVVKCTNDNHFNITIKTKAKDITMANDTNIVNSKQNAILGYKDCVKTNKSYKLTVDENQNDLAKEIHDDYFDVHDIIQTISSTLNATLLRIKTICLNTIKEIQDGATKEREKNLYDKTWRLHRYIVLIIEQLEMIVGRELISSREVTKPAIAPKDKAVYRDTILKFLTKTQTLEHILSMLLDEINEQCNIGHV